MSRIDDQLQKALNLYRSGDPVKALDCAIKKLRVTPRHVQMLDLAGLCAATLGRFSQAEKFWRDLARISPRAAVYNNLAGVLKEQDRLDEAEAACRQAIALQPDFVEGHRCLAILLRMLARYKEAEMSLRKALALKSDHADSKVGLGMVLLLQGQLEEGLTLYEARYDPECGERQHVVVPSAGFPQWRGESLEGKSILVCPEQGFGDAIQFLRYMPRLKAMGASRVTLICQPPLVALLEALPGVDRVLEASPDLKVEAHDYWTFPLSLPFHFHTTLDTIPASLPYLAARQDRIERWRPRLPKRGVKVGLIWKGSAVHGNDKNRSLPGLATLAPLWSVPEMIFVSLQKGQAENEAAAPPKGQPLVDLGRDIEDFADTAAIIAQLDLVICVDTAVAHLAGALGKTVWILLPSRGLDWRWLLRREDTPWYPVVMRLFRQDTQGDWGPVVERVSEALAALAR